MLHQEMLQANPQLSELPVILVLNKIDLRRQEQQEQGPSHDAELVESVRRQTGIKEVYAVSGESLVFYCFCFYLQQWRIIRSIEMHCY